MQVSARAPSGAEGSARQASDSSVLLTPEAHARGFLTQLEPGGGPNTPPSMPSWRPWLDELLERFRPKLRIRPTPLGLSFLGLTFAIGFAALNTGNNLLYLVLGMMLSLLSLSGVLSELSLRNLSVKRRLPTEVVATEDAWFIWVLQNNRHVVPAVGIWVEELWGDAVDGVPAFFPLVEPGQRNEQATLYHFEHRGRFQLTHVRCSTVFPFGLFRRTYTWRLADEVIVLPNLEDVKLPVGLASRQEGTDVQPRPGQGDEFLGLRPYQPGEDPRLIHWRSSARRGRMLVREQAALQRRRLQLRLELTTPLPLEDRYEEGIRKLASFAVAYLSQGYEVALELPGLSIPFGAGETQRRRMMFGLALAPRAAEAVEMPSRSPRQPGVGLVLVRIGEHHVQVDFR